MLNSAGLTEAAQRLYAARDGLRDRLNAADSALGDGDTGMTIQKLIEQVYGVPAPLPADLGDALIAWSRACMRASGSSLGTVIGLGLTQAGKLAKGKQEAGGADIAAMISAAIDGVVVRAGSKLGDKTVLDALDMIRAAMAGSKDGSLAVALDAARQALAEFRGRACNVGRARMYKEKSIGADDPGMLAAVLILETLSAPR